MEHIKVILLVCNIGLTFEIINSKYTDEIRIIDQDQNEENTNMLDEDEDKTIINLLENVQPSHYKVQLTVDTKLSYPNISLSGQVDINITIFSFVFFPNTRENRIQTLLLHAKNIELNNFQTTIYNETAIFFVKNSFTIQEEFLAIEFIELVPPGKYTLTIVFHSTVNDSFIRYILPPEHQTFGLKNDLIMTHFEKTAARQLFPCWDDPIYKTTFDIEVTHEDEYTVLSNMPVLKIDDADGDVLIDEPNMKCTKFVTTMMSTHQLVILLKPYDIFTDPTETVHTWRKSDKTSIISFIHNTANNISKYLQEYTATPLNHKIDHIVVPNAPYTKAQLGLIIYRESDVIYDETKDLIDVKNKVKEIIEYQVAQQWFGGLITPASWCVSCLTISFTLFFSYYFPRMKIDSQFDNAKLWENVVENKIVQLRIMENYNDMLQMDNGSMLPVVPFPEIIEPPSTVCHKGALILRMINSMLPEKKFQELIVDFLNKYKYQAWVTFDDFFKMLKDVKYSKPFTHFDPILTNDMEAWIMEKGYPIITVKIDRENDRVILYQTSSVLETLDYSDRDKFLSRRWWIPVTCMVKDNISSDTCNFLWVDPARHVLSFNKSYFTNKNNWILLNVGLTGYYHVRYERDNWESLGHFLKSKDYSRIPVLNRAQLINDICVEYRNHRTDWKLFELITSYLSQETDYIPWIAMLKCLDMLEEFFKLPESKRFQMHIANYFTPILNEIGYEEDPKDDDMTKKIRPKLAFYACALGNPTCRSAAADKLNKYFANRAIHKILPCWQKWTFCFGVIQNESYILFLRMYHLYIETKNKTFLNYLTCFGPGLMSSIFNSIHMKALVNPVDFYNTIIKKHINNDIFFTYIKSSDWTPKPGLIPYMWDTIISNIYSNAKLDVLKESIKPTVIQYFQLDYKIIQQQEKIAFLKYKIDMMFPEENS